MSRHVMIALALLLSLDQTRALAQGGENRAARANEAARVQPRVAKQAWGKTEDGTPVSRYTLTSGSGMTVELIDYGATLAAINVPDRNGKMSDVTLGFDDLAGYEKHNPFGGTVGRFGNRIANGKFTLGGKQYTLATNNGPNHLHGGKRGFDKYVWVGESIANKQGPCVRFTRKSPDGEEGYPGNLNVAVTYTLDGNAVRIDYEATPDQPTPVNLTNHAYFNLAGVEGPEVPPILDHVIVIHADFFLPVDETMIPTGKLAPVEGTPMDFRKPTPIGQRIAHVRAGKSVGYDHCYVVTGGGQGQLVPVATVTEPKSGRTMEVLSTEPGVQFYTSNFFNGRLIGKAGRRYPKHGGFCLETQHFPDSPNRANFPSVTLEPGETYRSSTVYRFSTTP